MYYSSPNYKTEEALYLKYSRNPELAQAMACVFNIANFAPPFKTLEEGVQRARTGRDWADVCLGTILCGKTAAARDYLTRLIDAEKASELKRTIPKFEGPNGRKKEIGYDALASLILTRLDEVVGIYEMARMEEIDNLRREVAPLINYLKDERMVIGKKEPHADIDPNSKINVDGSLHEHDTNVVPNLKIQLESISAIKRA